MNCPFAHISAPPWPRIQAFILENDDDPALNDSYLDDDPNHDGSLADGKHNQSIPLQKRRRVGRACDECRRKKIKCDGKQPCTHCTVYSYECTYDQPSNRRRNPAPQHLEALEARLHKAEAILRVVCPDVNLNDPKLDINAVIQRLASAQQGQAKQALSEPTAGAPAAKSSDSASGQGDAAQEGGEEGLLETMVDQSGWLDRDDQGHWDYHGHSSGIIFARRLRRRLGDQSEFPRYPSRSMLESPESMSESPQDGSLCHNALDDACTLMRFVHEPSFYASLERIYDRPHDQYTNEENSFLPLLYIVMAVGCLFSDDGIGTLDVDGYEGAIGQGFQFFKAGRQLLEITDCRDLTSLQAICFMVLFLQSSAKLSTCYSYVGIALRSALRLGLHRTVNTDFNPIEKQLRSRIFWVIRKMDVYVSTLLGFPVMLSDDDIDQEYPLPVDGEYITANGIIPMPEYYTPLMAAPNAHTHLGKIIMKVVKYIYPTKNARYRSKHDQRYMVSHSKIREIERDLQKWMEDLPPALRPGTEVSPQLERARQLLRISYAHVQMMMYRPFLHYVSGGSQASGMDKRSYACAAACVSVSRNIVHITAGMHKRGLLNGSFWFVMYTTYFAILSLIFFVVENPDSPTAKDGVLKDAMEGKATLAGLAKRSMAADRCSQSLNCLFKSLPEILKTRQSSKAPVNLKRPAPSAAAEPDLKIEQGVPRAKTFPTKRMQQTYPGSSNRRQKSMDTTPPVNNRPVDNGTPSAWQFNNPNNLPDLMQFMFPSDDPFAYPTQPMSKLEDDHFRYDNHPSRFQVDSSQQGMDSNSSSDPSVHNTTTPGLDSFPTFGNFGSSSGVKSSVPSRLHTSQPMGSPLLGSPISHSQTTPSEGISSPDLVSIPNQNFVWQGYNFQPMNVPSDQVPRPPENPSLSNAPLDLNMSMDENTFGANADLGILFDDLFGNEPDYRPGNGAPNEDWTQWMNPAVPNL
ncbi:hypothetical protein N7470_002253 [Penicillium chermesinum]|nr:hypothetical protein N7470_002253 [Penicillium chermesinum]